ncbi:hypothetical protein ACFL9T_21030 [Thermodesulfobacteriota bacterium]
MKLKDVVNIVDEGWVKKEKGYRIHFQRRVDSEYLTEYAPGEEEKPLDSEVTTWRLAKNLYNATQGDHPENADGEIVNIYVVDDSGNQIKYYATNQFDVFNPRDIEPEA